MLCGWWWNKHFSWAKYITVYKCKIKIWFITCVACVYMRLLIYICYYWGASIINSIIVSITKSKRRWYAMAMPLRIHLPCNIHTWNYSCQLFITSVDIFFKLSGTVLRNRKYILIAFLIPRKQFPTILTHDN